MKKHKYVAMDVDSANIVIGVYDSEGKSVMQCCLQNEAKAVRDVEASDVRELRSLVHAQPRDDGNLLVAFAQHADRRTRHRRGGRGRHVVVRQAGQIGLVGVGAQPDREALRSPVVAHANGGRNRAEDRRPPGRRAGAASRCPRPRRESTPGCRPAGRSRADARRGARRESCRSAPTESRPPGASCRACRPPRSSTCA